MEVTSTSFRVRAALALVLMCVGAFAAFLFLKEWWSIVVTENAKLVSDYHFGSESMMDNGGWWYSNPEVYAWTAFAEAFAMVSLSVLNWLAIVRRSRLSLVVIASLILAWWGTAALLGQLNWTKRATRHTRTSVTQHEVARPVREAIT